MNLTAKIFMAGSAAILLAGCYPQTTTTTPAPAGGGVETSETTMEGVRTYTLSEQNDSGQSGTMTLEEVGGQLRVTLDLTDVGNVPQPAHIHAGACPNPGAVTYPLTNVVNGTSTTMLDISFDELTGEKPLAVNVHKSAAESSVYTACGDL